MIVGYHLIMTAYGFWLPNDPRGSWSEFVGKWEFFLAGGRATKDKVTERRSYAHDPHDRTLRNQVKQSLSRPAVVFNGLQARAVAYGFEDFAGVNGMKIWACAIMPDHIHLVVGKYRTQMEALAIQLKSAATKRLVDEGIHPFQHLKLDGKPPPKCFAQGQWKGYLDPPDVEPAIRYVENNPIKAGLRRQRWRFVSLPDFQ